MEGKDLEQAKVLLKQWFDVVEHRDMSTSFGCAMPTALAKLLTKNNPIAVPKNDDEDIQITISFKKWKSVLNYSDVKYAHKFHNINLIEEMIDVLKNKHQTLAK
jgi:hypothetical protein